MNKVTGARGEAPFFFACDRELAAALTQIPGVFRTAGGIRCTADIAREIAGAVGVTPPVILDELTATPEQLLAEARAMPGYQRFMDLELHLRMREYQLTGAFFLARRAYALESDPMRSGKSVTALGGSELIASERTLIIAPAIAKYVWADECAKWLKESAVILSGRAGDEADAYCLACGARGTTSTGRCGACKLRNGQSNGYKHYDVHAVGPDCFCPKHPAESADADRPCPGCVAALRGAVERARYVIANYDILAGQKQRDARGVGSSDVRLPGWFDFLKTVKFDLAILDEVHMVRGFSTAAANKGQSRRERVRDLVEDIPTVWGLTGTPIFGYTRDLWGQLDVISAGAVTDAGNRRRLPFAWGARYCDGHRADRGWWWDGKSALAETELKGRLDFIKIQRPRSLILPDMPKKIRQVIRVDAKKALKTKPRSKGSDDSKLAGLMSQTLAEKIPTVVDRVVAELSEEMKTVVFVFLRQSAADMGKALEAAIQERTVRTRMREVNAAVWVAHGDLSPEARFVAARKFREHKGAGVFIATIDAVQVAVSLNGATSVHFADLHWQPAAMLQAEDRPYEPGMKGLAIYYYIVRESVDEHFETIVLPKVETLAALVDEKGADELKRALNAQSASATDILAAMMSAADLTLGAFDEEDLEA